jgi:hypothetical protein
VGLSPTGKRRLVTAHPHLGNRLIVALGPTRTLRQDFEPSSSRLLAQCSRLDRFMLNPFHHTPGLNS